MPNALQSLVECGQSPWIDFISRSFVRGGRLAAMVQEGIRGVTSNPTIFESAIVDGTDYDDQLHSSSHSDPKELFLELAADDIRDACEILAEKWQPGGPHGWVSLEVDPRLAHDAEATCREALQIHRLIERPNLFVKIPGTEEGITAVEDTIAAGIPVNVTLLFSLGRHRAAAEAYIRGLRRFRAAGGDLTAVASVASFFVSRVDTEADARLDQIGGHDELKGKLAIANAKLAYQSYLELFSGDAWAPLAAMGASPQHCLWASTGTKNPDYSDVLYVEELIGPDTVTTMPPATIKAMLDHGQVRTTLTSGVDDARQTFEAFAAAGVDYDELTEKLEREGVQKFADAFSQLFDCVSQKLGALKAA